MYQIKVKLRLKVLNRSVYFFYLSLDQQRENVVIFRCFYLHIISERKSLKFSNIWHFVLNSAKFV